jgi:hypothetical protein
MSFLASLLSFLFDVCSLFWLSFLKPLTDDRKREQQRETPPTAVLKLDASAERDLNHPQQDGIVSPVLFLTDASDSKEEFVSESSFLSQLEQRTQQVKITLANLEAEKVRIEGMIAQLQPLVPHYDALLAAERSISEAQIPLDTAEAPPAAPLPQQHAWDQPQDQPESNW